MLEVFDKAVLTRLLDEGEESSSKRAARERILEEGRIQKKKGI